MKSSATLRVVENNSHASKDFTIQASGKMFHMVISGLYSNKPQSITREIWSNAFDAHAMVGKEDVPFEVMFPTALNPTFTCRDFGPGIAHEDMEGFYTVLGHSTKEDTNKAVGKWGVGRMSPMSYTDTFSVVSRHKGMIAYYSTQLGPDGSPQLHVLAPPVPTDDPDGLEVSFPVKRYDLAEFQKAAEIVAFGFDVKPAVTNSKEKKFEPVKKVFEGEGYYLYEDIRLSGAYAQMGCVMYPIPVNYLPRRMNVVYQFGIGDLEVTASREALSFGPNDPTEANVRKKAEEVAQSIYRKMQEDIDAQPKLFLAAKLAPKLRANFPSTNTSFTYRGQDIPKYWQLNVYAKHLGLHCGHLGYRQRQAGWGLEQSIDVRDNYTIYVQDMSDKKANVRAAIRIGTHAKGDRQHYIWVRANLTDPAQKADLDRMIADLDYPVVYVKDLPDTGPLSSGGKRSVVKVSRLLNGRVEKWDMTDAEFTAGGYYYRMSNNNIESYIHWSAPLCKQLGMNHTLLVPKTLWKKFQTAPQWKSLEPAIRDTVIKEADNVRKTLGNNYKLYPYREFIDLKDVTGIVGDFARKVVAPRPTEYLGISGGYWANLLSHFNLPKFNNDLVAAEHQKILDTYPLLDLYRGGSSAKDDKFKHYIELLNNASKE